MKTSYLRSAISTLLLGTGLSLVQFGSASAQTITFEELLANPGNVSMELQYARQAERAQNYLSAMSAYERVLLNYAENDEARLRYAELLTSLDDLQAARREIEILEKRELSANQSRRLIAIGGTPVSSDGGGGFFGEVSAGVRYDDNIGSVLIDLPISIGKIDDFAGTLGATAGYAAPLSDGLSVHLGISGNTVRHEDISYLDYDTYGGFAGLGFQAGDTGKVSATLRLDNVNINNNRYQRQLGGQIKAEFEMSETVQLVGMFSYVDQDYEDIVFGSLPVTSNEDDRSGGYLSLATGPRFKLGDTTEIGIMVGFDDKNASDPSFAYDGWRLDGNLKSLIGEKSYVTARATYRDMSYDDGIRDDTRLFGRAAIGVSLDKIVSMDGLDLYWETGAGYLKRNSEGLIPPFFLPFPDYENVSLDSRIIAKF